MLQTKISKKNTTTTLSKQMPEVVMTYQRIRRTFFVVLFLFCFGFGFVLCSFCCLSLSACFFFSIIFFFFVLLCFLYFDNVLSFIICSCFSFVFFCAFCFFILFIFYYFLFWTFDVFILLYFLPFSLLFLGFLIQIVWLLCRSSFHEAVQNATKRFGERGRGMFLFV